MKLLKRWLRMTWYLLFYEKTALKNDWILMDSEKGRDLGSDMLRVAEELARNPQYRKYRIFITYGRKKKAAIARKAARYGLKRAVLIRENGFRHAKVAARAGHLFTDSPAPLWFAKKSGQVIVHMSQANPLRKMGKDARRQAFRMGNEQRSYLMADYLLYSSDFMKECMASAYFLDNLYQGKFLRCGRPGNAAFFDAKKAIAIRRELGLEGKRLYGCVLDWSEEAQPEGIAHFLGELDRELKPEEIFFVRLRPPVSQGFSFSEYKRIRPFPKEYDPCEILHMCDCMVTDYSGALFGYAHSRRKIVLWEGGEMQPDGREGYIFADALPFPKTRRANELLMELRLPKQYDEGLFLEKFCAYNREDLASGLCRHVLKGENVFEESRAKANAKENVLIYSGSLLKNGLTAALLNLFANINLEKRNYFVTFRSQALEPEPARIELLPPQVGFFPIATIRTESLGEAMAAFLYYRKNITAPFIVKKMDRYHKRLYQSGFGLCDFGSVIQYSGYEQGIENMFLQAPGRRMIFVHNDMVKEIATRHNQHEPTLRRVYGAYEKVIPVTEDIYPPTLKLGGNRGNIQVVNNCHDYKAVLEKAGREILFDEDTVCNKSLKELKEILKSGARKIITIGRFSPEKAHGTLLQAFDRYCQENPDSYLIIIGGHGELYEQTAAQAAASSCGGHVIIIRSISNPMPILKKCDLFVLSSLYEGLGLVLLEADTLGVPAISTDVPGPRCFMQKHGGYLTPPDAEGLYEGFRAFDRGQVKAMHVDYEEYNSSAVRQFEELFLS